MARLWKPSVILIWAAIVLSILFVVYRLVDPLPPRHFAIAAGIAGSGYDLEQGVDAYIAGEILRGSSRGGL